MQRGHWSQSQLTQGEGEVHPRQVTTGPSYIGKNNANAPVGTRESLVHLQCSSLDCMTESEYSARSHAGTGTTCKLQRDPSCLWPRGNCSDHRHHQVSSLTMACCHHMRAVNYMLNTNKHLTLRDITSISVSFL